MHEDMSGERAEVVRQAVARPTALLNRFDAAVRLLYPEDMTPNAARMLKSIIEEERLSVTPYGTWR